MNYTYGTYSGPWSGGIGLTGRRCRTPGPLDRPLSGLDSEFYGLDMPLTGFERPLNGLRRPVTGVDRSISGLNRPLSRLDRPAIEHFELDRSLADFDRPLTVVDRPMTGLDRPFTGLDRPVSRLEEPFSFMNASLSALDRSLAQFDEPEFSELRDLANRPVTPKRLDHYEIGQLRSTLEASEKVKKESAAKYEQQLYNLQDQVSGMKTDYDHVQHRYSKHAHGLQREPRPRSSITAAQGAQSDTVLDRHAYSLASSEIMRERRGKEFDSNDVKNFKDAILEYRIRATEWEKDRRSLVSEADSLRSEKKQLASKYESAMEQLRSCQSQLSSCQTQLSGYQAQLDKRREEIASTESALKTQSTQLRDQIKSNQEVICTQVTQVSRLKVLLDDAVQSQRKLQHDNELLESDLRKSNQTIRRLEAENSDRRQSLEKLQLQLRAAEELNSQQLKQQQLASAHNNPPQQRQQQSPTEQQQRQVIDELKHQLLTMLEDRSQLKQQLRSIQEEKVHLAEQQKQLLANQDDKSVHVEQLKQQLLVLSGEKSLLAEKLRTTEEDRAQLDKELCEVRQQLELAKDEHGRQNAQLSQLSKNLRSVLEEKTKLSEQVKELEVKLSQDDRLPLTEQLNGLRQQLQATLAEQCRVTEQLRQQLIDNENLSCNNMCTLCQNNKISFVMQPDHIYHVADNDNGSDHSDRDGICSTTNDNHTNLVGAGHTKIVLCNYHQQLEEMQQRIFSLEDELETKNKYLDELDHSHGIMSDFYTGGNNITSEDCNHHCSVPPLSLSTSSATISPDNTAATSQPDARSELVGAISQPGCTSDSSATCYSGVTSKPSTTSQVLGTASRPGSRSSSQSLPSARSFDSEDINCRSARSFDSEDINCLSDATLTNDELCGPMTSDSVETATEDLLRDQSTQYAELESILNENIDRLREETDSTLLRYSNNHPDTLQPS